MNSSNPYQSSSASNLDPLTTNNPNSLAQSARQSKLTTARWVLIFIGVLTLGVNTLFFCIAETTVNDQIKNELNSIKGGYAVNPADLAPLKAEAVRMTKIFSGIGAALGLVFILLGATVHMFPVAATVLGLVLYVGATIGFATLDPASLYRGILIKIIIVVSLVKSVQAAIAYQQEK